MGREKTPALEPLSCIDRRTLVLTRRKTTVVVCSTDVGRSVHTDPRLNVIVILGSMAVRRIYLKANVPKCSMKGVG